MNPDFLVHGNRIARRMLTRRKMRVPHAVKRDNATIFFRVAERKREISCIWENLPMVVRSIRDGSGRAHPSPLFARATLARADETGQFLMATTACRRRRASVIEPSGLEARDASSRASEANTKEEKSISPPRNNRSRAARRLSPARARQPHALSGSILEPCRCHPSRLIDHPLAQRTTVPFST